MKDATGEDIVLGHKYGYTTGGNGITDIIHCIAEKFNEQSVTVRPYKRFRAVYSNPAEERPEKNTRRATAVRPFILFPINSNQ